MIRQRGLNADQIRCYSTKICSNPLPRVSHLFSKTVVDCVGRSDTDLNEVDRKSITQFTKIFTTLWGRRGREGSREDKCL